nr:MAG TPA: hypothetical protein [Caudoviricetes sp.]
MLEPYASVALMFLPFSKCGALSSPLRDTL